MSVRRHTPYLGLLIASHCLVQSAHAQSSAATSPDLKAQESSLPAIEVVGRRQSGAYHSDEAIGSKTDLPLRELPQAVRIMSRQTLDDLGATRLDDALDYVGGVSRQNHFGGLWDNIAIRGFAGDVNNGMPLLLNGFSGNRGFNAPRDTANVERIEFLKGPAASLYGTSEPGGTLNVVTKKPLWRSAHSAEGYIGSFGLRRMSLDSTGPLGKDVAYRLNAAIETRDGFRDHVNSKREFLAPALTWRLSPSTQMNYSGEFLEHRTPLDRGVVAIGNGLGGVPRERFLGEPADGAVTVRNQTHQLMLDHRFNSKWSGRIALSYKEGSLNGYSTEAQPTLQPDNQTLRRQRRYRDYSSDDLTAQVEIRGNIQTGSVTHELLAGLENYRFSVDQLMLRFNPTAGVPYAIDVLNPVYGQPQPSPGPNTETREVQRNTAVYLQDAISLGEKWRLLAGVRFDRYDQSLQNRRTNTLTTQQPEATSPRLGLSYLLDANWTLFSSMGKSFRPNTGVSAAGASFEPESGRAHEAGVKWENSTQTLGGTLALYDIRKRNVLTPDPANAAFNLTAGSVRSSGMDIDVSGKLGGAWRINASFSLIKARVESDNTLEIGGRLLNIPKTNASVLLVREGALGSGRYGVGGGITYSGARLGEARTQAQANAGTSAFELPAYALAKVVAYWRASDRVRMSLDIDNLFDKTYYTNSFQRTWAAVGAPRTITLGLQAKF
jgi:iron complex outermembrane receptor protein